jgi:hypothetical protein
MSKKINNKKDNMKDRKNKLKYEKTNVKRSRKNIYEVYRTSWVSTPASYLGDPRFKSQPGVCLS